MRFVKKEFDSFRNDLAVAVKGIEEKYNLKFGDGNIKYDETSFRMTITWTKSDINVKKIDFEKYCTLYGLKPEDYGREFTLNGKRMILTGVAVKASKYSCECEEKGTGKCLRVTDEAVRRALAEENPTK